MLRIDWGAARWDWELGIGDWGLGDWGLGNWGSETVNGELINNLFTANEQVIKTAENQRNTLKNEGEF